MMTLFNVTLNLMVISLLLVLLVPMNARAVNKNYDMNQSDALIQYDIDLIDVELNNTFNKLRQIQDEREVISRFSGVAVSWFNRLRDNRAQIQKRRGEANNDLAGNPINIEIKRLEQELDSIENLNGGGVTSYSGLVVYTITDLYSEFSRTGEVAVSLNSEYRKLDNHVLDLNVKRNGLVADLEARGAGKKERLEQYNNELEGLEENYKLNNKLVNSESKWVWLSGNTISWGAPDVLHRNTIIAIITESYKKELKQSEQPFSQAELVSRIKRAQDISNKVKEELRNEGLHTLWQQIQDLKQRIAQLEPQIITLDLNGCWMLTVAKFSSQITVNQDNHGWYRGILTVKNKLRHYQQGQQIFEVQRTSESGNMYRGTDFSYTNDGYATSNPLTITMHSSGNSLTYSTKESDGVSSYQMHSCQ